MWRAAVKAGECRSFPYDLLVVFHSVVADKLIWGGDDQMTYMVVVEFRDRNGLTVYSWFTLAQWEELSGSLIGLTI